MKVVSKNLKTAATVETTQTGKRLPISRVFPDRASLVSWGGRVLCVALLFELWDV